MILQAKDLRFSYSKKGAPVLEGVSLSLHSGERLGLWAPSGRGKTLAESGMPEQRLLDALHIREGWLTRYPGELSGGELQRFCLARALHPAVKFLLCDESTAMLDLVTQAQIWDFLLREAASRDLGLLVVSHSAALLERVCTRTITLPE